MVSKQGVRADEISVAMLGAGEAGSRLAMDMIAAGAFVSVWDPALRQDRTYPFRLASGIDDAVAGAVLIVSVTSAAASVQAARDAASALRQGQVFADLNTALPSTKKKVAAEVARTGALFADVAILGAIPKAGIRTPAMASGPGAARAAQLLGMFEMPVLVLGGEPGDAAARKLVRSVFMKGIAAAIGEALEAANHLGCYDWLHDEIQRELVAADGALLDRLIEGSRLHSRRRAEEMRDAAQFLRSLGVKPRVALAAQRWLEGLAD